MTGADSIKGRVGPPRRTLRHLITATALASALLTAPVTASAGAGEDAVREVGALMAQERWEEALTAAREAPVREATRASLIGLIAMRTGAHEQAVASFQRALQLGPRRERLYLYLAWSHYHLDEPRRAREALTEVKSAAAQAPLYWLLRGRLARDAGDPEAAYDVLLRGNRRFPEDRPLARELGYVLVEFGALEGARRFLAPTLTSAGDEATIWFDAMRLLRVLSDRGDNDEALFYTELLRARLPSRAAQIDALAAHLHARARRPVAAANLFARATLRGGESFAFEAADQYRVAQMTEDAMQWNSRVADRRRRLEQRFLILTEAGRWARAAVVGRELNAAGGLGAASLRYRFGLALLIGVRDLDGARDVARRLGAAPEGARLAAFIERCERQPWRCQ